MSLDGCLLSAGEEFVRRDRYAAAVQSCSAAALGTAADRKTLERWE